MATKKVYLTSKEKQALLKDANSLIEKLTKKKTLITTGMNLATQEKN